MNEAKKQQIYIDKTSWFEGPWMNEPDRVLWIDSATGYHCLIRRSDRLGHLCGYVAVNPGHPYYGKKYGDLQDMQIKYSVNYSRPCDEDVERGVCHLTKNNDFAWWFRFDCGHSYDISPGTYIFGYSNSYMYIDNADWSYKDINYVTSQIESLAQKLKESEATEIGGKNAI